jgi:hypothetical protein
MASAWKECRCGRRIPKDWPRCGECQQYRDQDYSDPYRRQERHERAWGIRMAWEYRDTKPPLDPDVLIAIAKHATLSGAEQALADFRREMRSVQHLQVIVRNIRARQLDIADFDQGT